MIEDLIRRRRSVYPKQYNDKPVEKEVVERLLQAAVHAPTHKRTEPWRFKVVRGASRRRLGEFLQRKYLETETSPKQFKAKKLLENPMKAGAVIGICMQRDPQERLPEWEEIAATAMAVQNMWLTCTELGLGGYWSSPGLIRYMDEFFDLAEGERCLGFFYLGYYDQAVEEVPRLDVESRTEWL
ncbi:MAG: nitroreductase [Robiginitalea sp.]